MEKKTFWITAGTTCLIVAVGLFWWRSSLMTSGSANREMKNGLLAETLVQGGESYLIPPEDVYTIGVEPEEYPALTNPAFTTVGAMDRLLGDELYGMDVVVNGVHRYYPDQIMNWHQIVNDTFGDQLLLVVHDPLSGTSVVYKNTGNFKTSGKVYNDTLLMDDGAGSLWLASRGVAVVGPAVGQGLEQYPVQSVQWGVWKNMYPNGEVLSAEGTGVVRDYTRHPYGQYGDTATVYFPLNSTDARLNPKTLVAALNINGEQLAIPRELLANVAVMNDTVGGVPVTAFAKTEGTYTEMHVFSRTLNDRMLTFSYDVRTDTITDEETGSEWSTAGVCTKGELKDSVLVQMSAPTLYWFAWAAVFPDTRVNPDQTATLTIPSE